MALGVYLGAGSGITKLLMHMSGNSNDSSGNGNNGSDTSVSYVNDLYGQAASYNGTTSFTSTNNLGIAADTSTWVVNVKMNAEISADTDDFISQRNSSVGAGFNIQYQYNGGTRRLMYLRNRSGVGSDLFYYNTTLGTTNKYRIIMTYDGTTLKGYFNGQSVGSVAASGSGSPGANGTYIARDIEGGSSYANAREDEIIVENVAWDAPKIIKDYTYSVGRFGII